MNRISLVSVMLRWCCERKKNDGASGDFVGCRLAGVPRHARSAARLDARPFAFIDRLTVTLCGFFYVFCSSRFLDECAIHSSLSQRKSCRRTLLAPSSSLKMRPQRALTAELAVSVCTRQAPVCNLYALRIEAMVNILLYNHRKLVQLY